MRYKFVELSVVTDESIEEVVNRWVADGWQLDGIRFVTTEASRRPSMAFVSFVRADEGDDGDPVVVRPPAARLGGGAADRGADRAAEQAVDRDDDPDLRLDVPASRRRRRQPRRPR